MPKKFLRRTWDRYSKLGKGRKKKQKWRKPTGRDNKMREKRKNRPAVVSIGYKKSERKEQLVINNLKGLEKFKKNEMIIIGNVGRKKKIEIAKKANEKGIKISNLNLDKFLKKITKIETKKSEEKKKIEEKKIKRKKAPKKEDAKEDIKGEKENESTK